jgi:iron complex outermembrane recepter protein
MKRSILFAIILFITSASIAQQKIQLTGKVTDANTNMALAGATIVLTDLRLTAIADSAGNYLFHNVPSGHTMIEVSYVGYSTIVDHVAISGTSATKNFSLTPSIIENEGVTVTAVASATSVRSAPIVISKITRAELLARPSTNLIDALSHVPGVNQVTTGPAVSKPSIRGLGYNRLVVINDGIRQEGQQWGDEHGIEIDENSVSRVEIVKGPASLIYGSDAIAGVINIITTIPVPANTVKGSILTSYQTNNRQRSLYGNIGGNRNGFNWNMWGDYKAAADYRNKYDGRVFNSKFNEGNFGGYVGVNSSWGFSHLIMSSFNQKLGIIEGERNADGSFIKPLPGGVDGTPTEGDFNSTTPFIPYQQIRHLKITSDNSFKAGTGKITLNLGWQRNQRTEFGNSDNPSEKGLYFDLGTINYNVAYHLAEKNRWVTSIGVNGMQQTNKNKGSEVLIPEYSLFDIGAFIYTQKKLDKIALSGGVRFDNRSVNSKKFFEGTDLKFNNFTKNFSNFSGSAGLSYAPAKSFVLKLNLARGFRAPSIPELAANGVHEGTFRYELGDQDLKSESSFQADLGIELNSDHVFFAASLFYNNINDFIFYRKLNAAGGGDSLILADGVLVPAFRFSQNDATLTGAEFRLDLHPHPIDWLHWETTFSYVQGRFKEAIGGSNNVPFIPAARIISELRTTLFSKGKTLRNVSLSFEADHTFAQEKPFKGYKTETATPGYTLLNAGITANITNKEKTLVTLYLLGNNITDVAYQSHLSRLKYAETNPVTGRTGVYNVGRNFMVKLNIPLSLK